MSRERPTAPPKAIPDADRGVKITARQERQRAELERLKAVHGPGLLAGFFNPMMRRGMKAPSFIRRGYEANIVDELRDFFTFRSWRPKNCRPALRTHKEQTTYLRRARAAGLIVRLGRGRYGLAKVEPRA